MFLQDTTGSFQLDLPNVVKNIPFIVKHIEEAFPGSHYGVAEFQDKPFFPLGEPNNVCYKLAGPLSSVMAEFEEAYATLYASGGGDLPEDQYQALINIALDSAVGWRPYVLGPDGKPVPGSIGGRIVIMSTDAVPHIAGDMAKLAQYPTVPQGFPPNTGLISTDDVNYECLNQEYPTPDQLRNVLKSTGTTLIILTPEDPRVAPVWRWVNEVLLEQPAEFYRFIEPDSSNLHLAVVSVLESIAHLCRESTTTSTLPTTPTTTVKPTTSTTPLPTTRPTTQTTASTPTMSSASTNATTQHSSATTSSPECDHCPCEIHPCRYCPPECKGAMMLRFKNEPKRLQVILNNE